MCNVTKESPALSLNQRFLLIRQGVEQMKTANVFSKPQMAEAILSDAVLLLGDIIKKVEDYNAKIDQ